MEIKNGNPKNFYALVANLSVENPLQLAPGVTIRPLTCDLTVMDLAAVGVAGFQEWAVLGSLAHKCVSEIESAADSATTPGYDALGRVWLASALLSLCGFDNHMCPAFNTYSWDLVAGRVNSPRRPARYPHSEKLPKFEGGLIDFHLQVWSEGSQTSVLTKDDADWVYQYFNIFNYLNSESDSFRLAVEASVDWRFSKDPRSAIARIWCGIEAICGVSSELVYRIALICSSLLEERGEKRFERFENIRKLYNFRSKAVHGDELSEEQMTKTMFSSYKLLRDLIILTGERGQILTDKEFNHGIFF